MQLASPFQLRLSAFRGAALEREREDNSQGCLAHVDSMGWNAERQWCGQFGWKELYYFIHICNLPSWLFSCLHWHLFWVWSLAKVQALNPMRPWWLRVLHPWLGLPKASNQKSFAVCRWGKWQFVSRGDRGWVAPSTLGVGFVRGPGIDRVAEKEIQRRCHFGWFWKIAFQETSSHCYGKNSLCIVQDRMDGRFYSESRISNQSFEIYKPGILVFLKEGSVLQGLRGPKSIPCACTMQDPPGAGEKHGGDWVGHAWCNEQNLESCRRCLCLFLLLLRLPAHADAVGGAGGGYGEYTVYPICILCLPWNSMATSGTSSWILWWVGRVMIRIFVHGLLSYYHLVGKLTVSSTHDMMSRFFECRSGNHLHKNSLCQLFAAKSSAFLCQELQLLTDSLTRTILTLARQGAPSSRWRRNQEIINKEGVKRSNLRKRKMESNHENLLLIMMFFSDPRWYQWRLHRWGDQQFKSFHPQLDGTEAVLRRKHMQSARCRELFAAATAGGHEGARVGRKVSGMVEVGSFGNELSHSEPKSVILNGWSWRDAIHFGDQERFGKMPDCFVSRCQEKGQRKMADYVSQACPEICNVAVQLMSVTWWMVDHRHGDL